jgi:large subunit ribosomal protein L22
VRAQAKYVRHAPRKARPRGRPHPRQVDREARAILSTRHARLAVDVLKLLESASANAENNQSSSPTSSYRKAYVDEGPTTQALTSRALGRARGSASAPAT